ncbi:hypothetical protein VPH35_010050 [Triticum aestivum]
MNLGGESSRISCSDLALVNQGEEDDECGGGGMALPILLHRDSASQVHVPDIDYTDSHREPPSESQHTPTPWPQRVRLGKIHDRRASLSGRKSALEKAMRNYTDRVKPTISRAVSVDSFCS